MNGENGRWNVKQKFNDLLSMESAVLLQSFLPLQLKLSHVCSLKELLSLQVAVDTSQPLSHVYNWPSYTCIFIDLSEWAIMYT